MQPIYRSTVAVVSRSNGVTESGKITLEGSDEANLTSAENILTLTNSGNAIMDTRKLVAAFNVGGLVRAKYHKDGPNAPRKAKAAPTARELTPEEKVEVAAAVAVRKGGKAK